MFRGFCGPLARAVHRRGISNWGPMLRVVIVVCRRTPASERKTTRLPWSLTRPLGLQSVQRGEGHIKDG